MELFRSMFYTSLGRLLMVDLGEDEEKFDAFMIPLTQSFESLGQVLLNSGSSKSTTFDTKLS
jgi:exportin-7